MLRFMMSWLQKKTRSNKHSEAADNSISTFPKRRFYPFLTFIDTQQLIRSIDKDNFILIDVRESSDFNTAHIKSALNIALTDTCFDTHIVNFARLKNRDLIIYSDSRNCSQSYIASTKIQELFDIEGLQNVVFTYDSGISAMRLSDEYEQFLNFPIAISENAVSTV